MPWSSRIGGIRGKERLEVKPGSIPTVEGMRFQIVKRMAHSRVARVYYKAREKERNRDLGFQILDVRFGVGC
jgi:hypothetical protein